MKHLLNKTCFSVITIIVFSCFVIFSSPECSAQELFKISDDRGGSGGSTTGQPQNTGDNSSTLIIVGAAVIVGFLVYKLVINKDESKKNEKKDSTSNQSILMKQINVGDKHIGSELNKLLQMPVNFYVGIQRADVLMPERKIIFGISCNF